jgi:hypothetical protein
MSDTDTQLQVDVGIIKSQLIDFGKQMDRNEKNSREGIGRIEQKLDNMVYTPLVDFNDYKKEVQQTYLTKAEARPLLLLFWGTIGTALAGLVLEAITLLGAKK